MKISAKSDIGKLRKQNEDRYDIGAFDDGTSWAVVCDGMGGHAGGEKASEIAVKTVADAFKSSYRQNMTFFNIKNLFSTAISAANIKVYDEAKKNPELNGMGTTLCLVLAFESVAYVAHIGDSRVYLISGKNTEQVTKDHSLVQQLLDAGIINSEEASVHPQKNIITRAVGIDEDVEFDFTQIDIKKGDKILICSDGLTNMVSDSEITDCLNKYDVKDYADKLCEMANNAGGKDNITVVVMTV